MHKTIALSLLLLGSLATTLVACMGSTAEGPKVAAGKPDSTVSQAERIRKGEYLVSIIGCDDCHSPKKMGAHGPEIIPELRLSGYPASRPIQKVDSNVIKQGWALLNADLTSAVGPWGVSFAANITSDYTGIGNWSEENFLRSIRKGKFKGLEGSRDLLPPMPWFIYRNMTDEDLKSVFAYLKTVPAVENVVPAPRKLADVQ